MSMAHWVEMDIIDMPLEIALVADLMLVEATLPDGCIAVFDA
jgi:hypothetical protein